MCGRYRLSRRKRIIEEHFDSVSGEERLDTALQRRFHSTSLHHPAASERAESCAVPSAVGSDSVVGEGHVRRGWHD
jgi:hypothetical protein